MSLPRPSFGYCYDEEAQFCSIKRRKREEKGVGRSVGKKASHFQEGGELGARGFFFGGHSDTVRGKKEKML